jgi:hypothetical protein
MYFGMDDYKLIIPHNIYHKVMWWVNMAKGLEVSGFGTVEVDHQAKTFKVTDAFLIKQENTTGDTEMDELALGRMEYECHKRGVQAKWWWHSHHSMGVFWSQTDVDTIEQLGKAGWILATVFNNKWEYKSAFYTQITATSNFDGVSQLENEIYVDDLETDVVTFINKSDYDQWEAEYKALVSEKKWTPSVASGLGNKPDAEITGEMGKLIDADADGRLKPIVLTEFGLWMLKGTTVQDLHDHNHKEYMADPRFFWMPEDKDRNGTVHQGYWDLTDAAERFERQFNNNYGNGPDKKLHEQFDFLNYGCGGDFL